MFVGFSCPGGAEKGHKEEKAGSGMKRVEKPAMDRRGGRTLPWCQELGCSAAEERQDQGRMWNDSLSCWFVLKAFLLRVQSAALITPYICNTHCQGNEMQKSVADSKTTSIWQGTAKRKFWRSFGMGNPYYTAKQSHFLVRIGNIQHKSLQIAEGGGMGQSTSL